MSQLTLPGKPPVAAAPARCAAWKYAHAAHFFHAQNPAMSA
jgi:hypothetical protein